MKNIEIKISGSGTINQVGIRLYEIAAQLLNSPEDVKEGTNEDSVLIAEIIEEY